MVSLVTFSQAADIKTISTPMSTAPASRLFRTRTLVGTASVTPGKRWARSGTTITVRRKPSPNNVMGLNGMKIVYDRTDPGHEHPSAGSLQLPGYYGVTDIPLILTEKRFCNLDAQGRNEMVNAAGGDKWVVNGAIQPRFAVQEQKVPVPHSLYWTDNGTVGPSGSATARQALSKR